MTAPRTDREKVAVLCHRLQVEAAHRAGRHVGLWVQHPNRAVFALAFLTPPERLDAEDDAEWTG